VTQSADRNPDQEASNALRLIGADPENWVPEIAGIDHDVAIVGGGQSGRTFAFALRRAGIARVTVVDDATEPGKAGIWRTVARMHKLRTPKTLPGPELGIPALSFQAWYEARRGRAAYAEIDRILRIDWAEYLDWYRRVVAIPLRFRTRLVRIEPADDRFRLHLEIEGVAKVETARKIILANGFLGGGGAYVPSAIAENLPQRLYAHTAHNIDFDALRGKQIAVVGAAAAAFDAAGTALEAGAKSVDLFVRRAAIPAEPVIRVRGYPGAYDNYFELPDAVRWQQALRFRSVGSTPPPDAIERAVKHPNFRIHLNAPWTAARMEEGRIAAVAGGQNYRFDFVIAGTGYFVSAAARPELADFASEILSWGHRFVPPSDQVDAELAAHPYLGAGHEYLERTPGSAPYLRDIHVFNPAAFVSFGLPIGDVPSFKRDIPSIVRRVSHDLFFADFEHHRRRMIGDIAPDFGPELYASAVAKRPAGLAAE
jgi:cation diffusion facilitator CzcD-associated flavoprotein CzcO